VNQVEDKETALFRDFTQRRMVVQKRLDGTAILHCVKSQKSLDVIYTAAGLLKSRKGKFAPQCDKCFSRGGGYVKKVVGKQKNYI
jgi:hypothetical protein